MRWQGDREKGDRHAEFPPSVWVLDTDREFRVLSCDFAKSSTAFSPIYRYMVWHGGDRSPRIQSFAVGWWSAAAAMRARDDVVVSASRSARDVVGFVYGTWLRETRQRRQFRCDDASRALTPSGMSPNLSEDPVSIDTWTWPPQCTDISIRRSWVKTRRWKVQRENFNARSMREKNILRLHNSASRPCFFLSNLMEFRPKWQKRDFKIFLFN